ncbi:hypothetical protein HXX76_006365 [Chlamydomonas incerta]|uniref:DNA (cytosine-5-)-methyltransferase n=1 Tax=Chlamydomonas incerta TaxID=51695 RepID=A0A835TDJ0_CHLIN|nr:hypothetical protein HXX76_006365 [Chlamydomonas incerta]|eukprot:KAG2436845.1 hypothetical protein HXX76_006365 [Chlamydomonas incerta]
MVTRIDSPKDWDGKTVLPNHVQNHVKVSGFWFFLFNETAAGTLPCFKALKENEKDDKRRFVKVVLPYNQRLVYRSKDRYGDWCTELLLGDLRTRCEVLYSTTDVQMDQLGENVYVCCGTWDPAFSTCEEYPPPKPGLLRLASSPRPLPAAEASDLPGRALDKADGVPGKVVAGTIVPHFTANGAVPDHQALAVSQGQRAPHPDLNRFEPGDGLVLNVCAGVGGSTIAATRELAEAAMDQHQRMERERQAREKETQGNLGEESGPSVNSSSVADAGGRGQDSGGSSGDIADYAAERCKPGAGAGNEAAATGGSGSNRAEASCSQEGPGRGSRRGTARADETRPTSSLPRDSWKRLSDRWVCEPNLSALTSYIANHGLEATAVFLRITVAELLAFVQLVHAIVPHLEAVCAAGSARQAKGGGRGGGGRMAGKRKRGLPKGVIEWEVEDVVAVRLCHTVERDTHGQLPEELSIKGPQKQRNCWLEFLVEWRYDRAEDKEKWPDYPNDRFQWVSLQQVEDSPTLVLELLRRVLYTERLLPLRGTVLALGGGPPCQDLTGHNRSMHGKEVWGSPRNRIIGDILELVKFLEIPYVLIEQVRDAVRGDGAWRLFVRAKAQAHLGYQIRDAILHAPLQGCPQIRSRLITWMAAPGYQLPPFPRPEFSSMFAAMPDPDAAGTSGLTEPAKPYPLRRLCTVMPNSTPKAGEGTMLYPPQVIKDAVTSLPARSNYDMSPVAELGDSAPATALEHVLMQQQQPPPDGPSPEQRFACYLGNACGTVMQYAVAVLEQYRAGLAAELDAELQATGGGKSKRRVPSNATKAQKEAAYASVAVIVMSEELKDAAASMEEADLRKGHRDSLVAQGKQMVDAARTALQQALQRAPRCLELLQAALTRELRSDPETRELRSDPDEVVDLTLDSDSDYDVEPPQQPVRVKRRLLSGERSEPAAAAAPAPSAAASSGDTEVASDVGQVPEDEDEDADAAEEEDEDDESAAEEEADEDGLVEEDEEQKKPGMPLPNHVPYPMYLEEVQRAELLGTDTHGVKAFSGHALLAHQDMVLPCGLPVLTEAGKAKLKSCLEPGKSRAVTGVSVQAPYARLPYGVLANTACGTRATDPKRGACLHFRDHRVYTTRELASLQTFPYYFAFLTESVFGAHLKDHTGLITRAESVLKPAAVGLRWLLRVGPDVLAGKPLAPLAGQPKKGGAKGRTKGQQQQEEEEAWKPMKLKQAWWLQRRTISDELKQVGNSVPPLLAAALSRCLGLALLGREDFPTGQAYVPDPRWAEAWSWAAGDDTQSPACVYSMTRGLVGKVMAGPEEEAEAEEDDEEPLDVDEFEGEYDAPYADSTADEDGEESGSEE